MRNHLSAHVHLFAAIFIVLLFTLSACQRMLPLQFEAGPADETTVIKLEIQDKQFMR